MITPSPSGRAQAVFQATMMKIGRPSQKKS
jgi:hypothetical protein